MTPAASEVQLHPGLVVSAAPMTPLHVRRHSRAAPCLRVFHSRHGAISTNVSWLTPANRKAPAVGADGDMAPMLTPSASRLSDGTTYCKQPASDPSTAMFNARPGS